MLDKGLYYLEEDTPTPRYDSAVFYLEKAAKLNNMLARQVLAEQYLFGSRIQADTVRAQVHIKEAINRGDKLIYLVLAKYYYSTDINKSINYLKKGDDHYAGYELAQLLISGSAFGQPYITYNSKIDEEEGLKYLIKSADAGNFFAQKSLVFYYLKGIKGVLSSDTIKAMEYYKKASNNPDVKCIEGAADELEILSNDFR